MNNGVLWDFVWAAPRKLLWERGLHGARIEVFPSHNLCGKMAKKGRAKSELLLNGFFLEGIA